MEHEEAWVRAFMLPERAKRYAALLALGRTFPIWHISGELDPRYAHKPPAGMNGAEELEWIYRTLRDKGAPETCHVLFEGEADLREALEEEFGASELALSCLKGRLGFYQAEAEPGERYVLERHPRR